jgi:hypothetical protein
LTCLHAAPGGFYAGGDAEPVRELPSEEVEWHVPGRSAIAGDYHGIDTVLDYFAQRRDLAQRTFRMHPGEILIGTSTLPYSSTVPPRSVVSNTAGQLSALDARRPPGAQVGRVLERVVR